MAKADTDMLTDDTLDGVSSEPRVYELGFHLDPELPTEEVNKAYKVVRDFILERGAVVAEGEPQKIPLAYTISRQDTSGRRDFDSAHFSWIVYETTAENHGEIISMTSGEKRIIRFIDILTSKDAGRHSAEMREIFMKAQDHTEDPEEIAGAELDAALENVVV